MKRFLFALVLIGAAIGCGRQPSEKLRLSSIAGSLSDMVTGRVLQSGSVVLNDSQRVARIDSFGSFVFDSLASGTYRLTIRTPDHQHLILESVALADSQKLYLRTRLLPDWLVLHKTLTMYLDQLSGQTRMEYGGRDMEFLRAPVNPSHESEVLADAPSISRHRGGGIGYLGYYGRASLGDLGASMGAGGEAGSGGTGISTWQYRQMYYEDWYASQIGQMRFTGHGISGFIPTARQKTSTFSLDVSSASYGVVRRILTDYRRLPPPDAVRIEEMINYFDLRDTTFFDKPFLMRTCARQSPISDSTVLLKVDVQSRTLKPEERKPLRMTVLLDISGSMYDSRKISLVRHSLQRMLPNLTQADRLALVTFGATARVAVEPTDDFRRVLRALDSLGSEGWTDLETGLRTAYGVAMRQSDTTSVNHVMLWTDGVANKGQTTTPALLGTIERGRQRGIYLMACGVGVGEYHDAALEELARKGDGRHYYIDSEWEAEHQFVQGYWRTVQIVARDVRVQAVWDSSVVESYRLVGYEKSAMKAAAFTEAGPVGGEIGAGHYAVALYELKLKNPHAGIAGTLKLRYVRPGGAAAEELEVPVSLAGPTAGAPSDAFDFLSAVALYGELLRRSPHAKTRRLSDVIECLRKTDTPFRTRYPEYVSFAHLVYLTIGLIPS
jgi:Ca-activated chloride channel family protein